MSVTGFSLRSALALTGLLAVAALTAPRAHAQNLLVNGSFETGNFTGSNPQGAADSTQLAVGATNITGWTVVGDEIQWQGNNAPYTILASDGNRSLDVTGYSDSLPHGGVSQSVSLVTGAQYRLMFDVGYNQTYSAPVVAVDVSTDGTNFLTFTNTLGLTGTGINRYQTFTYDFTATLAATPVTLRGSTTTGGNAIVLDNVRLTALGGAAAPEPGTLALLGLGVAPVVGLGARRRRDR